MLICCLNLRRIAIAVFVVNVILTIFSVFIFLSKGPKSSASQLVTVKPVAINLDDDWTDIWGPGFPDETKNRNQMAANGPEFPGNSDADRASDRRELQVVEIWSKAAIGLYLWHHILRGKIERNIANGMYLFGVKRFPDSNIKFRFRSGPTVTIDSLRKFTADAPVIPLKGRKKSPSFKSQAAGVKNLILVLNGRDDEKIEAAEEWIKELQLIARSKDRAPPPHNGLNVGVVMLGREDCFNNWIHKYLWSRGGVIKFLFVTYDWEDVNEADIFQWPLGVATYRNFPAPDHQVVQSVTAVQSTEQVSRPYVCNFLGTVYANTTRQNVASAVKLVNQKYSFLSPVPCFLHERKSWLPSETQDSLSTYIQALSLSDLTLSPIGRNHECYRIYEAMSLGSIPVLEESLSHVKSPKSSCDQNQTYRLLKKYDAPIFYVKNWTTELPVLIDNEINSIPREEKTQRSQTLVKWYSDFRSKIRNKLLATINRKFFLT